MWTKAFAAVLLAAVVAVVLAGRDTPVREALLPKPSAAEAALERVLPEVQIVDQPFYEALQRLEALGGIDLVADWDSLEGASSHFSTAVSGPHGRGFDRKAPVSLQARGIRLADALSRVLAQQPDRLAFSPDDGVVLISRPEVLARKVSTRCYPVRDLVARDDGPPPPMVYVGGPISGAHVPAWQGEVQRGEDLVGLLENVVTPDSWLINGGQSAQARYLAGHIVVVHMWEGHRQVDGLLRGLRQPVPGPAPEPAASSDLLLWNEAQRQWLAAGPDAAERMLRTVLPEVRLEEATLPAAVEQVARLARANIVLDRDALEGYDFDRTMHLRLYDVTLQQALEAVVERFSSTGWSLDYDVHAGLIAITTPEKVQRRPVTRVYDLRDWPHAGAWAGRKRASSPVQQFKEPLQDVVSAITASVAPETWRDNGGSAGFIHTVEGRLVILQTWRNQEKVRKFMDALRAGPPATEPALSPAVPATRDAG